MPNAAPLCEPGPDCDFEAFFLKNVLHVTEKNNKKAATFEKAVYWCLWEDFEPTL